jgi:hypothetical protein
MSEAALDDVAPPAVDTPSDAATRSRLYALFAAALQFPRDEIGDALADGGLYQSLDDAARALP